MATPGATRSGLIESSNARPVEENGATEPASGLASALAPENHIVTAPPVSSEAAATAPCSPGITTIGSGTRRPARARPPGRRRRRRARARWRPLRRPRRHAVRSERRRAAAGPPAAYEARAVGGAEVALRCCPRRCRPAPARCRTSSGRRAARGQRHAVLGLQRAEQRHASTLSGAVGPSVTFDARQLGAAVARADREPAGRGGGRGDRAEAPAGGAVVARGRDEHRPGALDALGGDRLGRGAEGGERLGHRREDHVRVIGQVSVAVRVERAIEPGEQRRGRPHRARPAASRAPGSARARPPARRRAARGPAAARDDAGHGGARARRPPGRARRPAACRDRVPAGREVVQIGMRAVDRAVEQRDASRPCRRRRRPRAGAQRRPARPGAWRRSRPGRACAPGTRPRPRAPRAAARSDRGAPSPRRR